MTVSFLGLAVGTVIAAVSQSNRYEAAMEILVQNARANPVVTPGADSRPYGAGVVTEEELNSEVELLKTHDILQRTVIECGLQNRERSGAVRWATAILAGLTIPDSAEGAAGTANDRSDVLLGPNATEGAELGVRSFLSLWDPTAVVDGTPAAVPEGFALLLQGAKPRAVDFAAPANLAAGSFKTERQPAPIALEGSNAAFPKVSTPDRVESNIVLAIGNELSAAGGAHSILQVNNTSRSSTATGSDAPLIAAAIQRLRHDLHVDVVKKTNLIEVGYESNDPQLAARVLKTLESRYLEKHIAVHRSQGAFDFFQQVRQRYRDELAGAEARLSYFNLESNVVSPAVEKDIALQKLGELELALVQTRGAIQEKQQLMHTLESEIATTPKRVITQLRATDDAQLLSQLRSTLLGLEQKRIELLDKFEPGYRSVQELDAQIAQARTALASAEKSQLHEETTDRDPAYEWARQELAKSRADLAELGARAQATAAAVRSYQETARSLEQKQIVQYDLVRDMKTAEENYLLSLRKEEETRITDALDRGRILNVSIADAASVPSIPINHRYRMIAIGFMMAMVFSVTLGFTAERVDPTFRTPDELETLLEVPVLAAIPQCEVGRGAVGRRLSSEAVVQRRNRPDGDEDRI